ncbi:MAG TPA: tetratricopeptide repeat protein, partial [Planctomycetota bacterium]|nr:tetratricopeptide repeat protein [Planctomycetota bacterium]
MNKEQIAFIIALLLLGLFWFGCQDSETPTRGRTRGGSSAGAPIAVDDSLRGRFLKSDDLAWVGSGTNVFQAPRELKPLPPLKLLPPPFPRLPHPGLPTVPGIGGAALGRLRHELIPNPNMAIPTEGTVTRIEDPTATSDAEAELETVDTSSVGMSLADQIRMKEEERIALEKEQKALAVRRENRQRTLDRVLWESGQTSYGEIRSLRSEESRYAMKLKLDALRGDPAMGEDQRRKELDRLKFAFYEDRGEGRRPSRSIISGLTVNRLEFAEAFPINRFEIERLTVAADNEDAQLRLADGIYESGEYASVADHLDALHSRGMGNPSSFLRLSDCYRRLLRYDDELRVIEQGLARFSDSAQLRAAEGDIYLNIGLVARAIKSYEQALASDPVFPAAHFGLGRAYLSEKRPTEALPHLRQAQSGSGLRDAEERLLALVLLGETYLLLGDLPAAVRTLDTALDRNPEHPRALLGRAVVTLADTGPDAALVYVLRGRGAAPLNGALAYMEGVCTLRIGDYARAYSSLLVAMDLDPLIAPE